MIAIELNGCSGGMAEGFRRAGIEFTWCFDWDPDACASYEANIGHRPVRMDIRDVVRMVRGGWSPGPVDLLVADPPCTPYSRAGKRKRTADERDLLEETCELIGLLRPRAYLIGNVPGLQDATAWHIVQQEIGGLARHGYCVADYQQLDAADYGVPQHRIRPFWFGHLAGSCITWPAPTHGAPTLNGALAGLGLPPWVTCREALAHLPAEVMGRPVRLPRHAPAKPDAPAPTVAAKVRGQSAQILALEDSHGHPTSKSDLPAWTITADGGRGGKRSSVVEPWPWNRPATTVCRDPRIPPPGHHDGGSYMSPRPAQGLRIGSLDAPSPTIDTKTDRVGAGASHVMEWPYDRPSTVVCAGIDKIAPAGEHAGQFGPNAIVLSERAAAILQGFPEGWVFHGKTKKSRWSQLGQAMPPALAAAVGSGIVAHFDALAAAARRVAESPEAA